MAPLMTRAFCLFFIVGVLSAANTKLKPLSTYFRVCSRADVNKLNECMKQSITEARPLLTKGIPAIGIIPLKPLVIPRLELEEGSGNFKLKTIFTNFVLNGFENYIITNVKANLNKENTVINIDIKVPSLNATADYQIDGQVLILPIQGQGFCEMRFGDLAALGEARGRLVTRDGEEYIDITKFSWNIQFQGKVFMWFHNLFNGDDRIGNATNTFLNVNNKEASDAFKHLPEEALAEFVKSQIKKVFDVYPLSQLFLDN